MQDILSFVKNLDMRMPSMDLTDVIEILIISFLIYHILTWIKNTRAWALLKGLLVICAFLLVAAYFRMNTILWIASNVLTFAVTALIIVLQPELRKALEDLGNKNLINSVLPLDTSKKEQGLFSDRTINEIVKACVEMSRAKTGALIVVQQKQPLGDFERTGIEVDGIVTSQLLINIFEHNTPLHDGAVIVKGDRVTCATCYLPLSDNMNLDKGLGTRHRAGLGVTEMTDAMTIIVSEETGKISIAYKGGLERGVNAERLKEQLCVIQNKGEEENKKIKRWGGRSKNEKETAT
ncbi:MAG: TIGR00159 family protein [Lachnospiraceae bacterium]|nr:TIGR00159 family protein [Lachnospiraceae bacterium]